MDAIYKLTRSARDSTQHSDTFHIFKLCMPMCLEYRQRRLAFVGATLTASNSTDSTTAASKIWVRFGENFEAGLQARVPHAYDITIRVLT